MDLQPVGFCCSSWSGRVRARATGVDGRSQGPCPPATRPVEGFVDKFVDIPPSQGPNRPIPFATDAYPQGSPKTST